MTCVVGITNGKRVVIGADSAFTKGDSVVVTDSPGKILKTRGWVIAFCGHMDVICACWESLPSENWSTIGELVSVIRGISQKNSTFEILAGHKGILYSADDNGAWFRCQDRKDGRKLVRGTYAVGSGSSYALGSLYSTTHMKNDEARIRLALEASIYYSDGVRGPFRIVSE